MSTPVENSLPLTLFGKTRRAVLSLLYGHADESFYLRQIARATGGGLGSVQRELKQLTDAGIIKRTVQGRQVYYRANKESPVFPELKSLIMKSAAASNYGNTYSKIPVPRKRLADFCKRHHIRRLALYGSVLREDFRPDSDVDVLVEFEPGHTPGFAIIGMEQELSRLFGRKVDLRTPKDLSRYFREQVVREARVEYEAGRS